MFGGWFGLGRLVVLGCRRLGGLRRGWCLDSSRCTSPDETSAMVIGDRILRVKQFLLEQGKAVIIQRELDFEGSIGYTPMPLEEFEYPFEYLIEVHHRPSDNACRVKALVTQRPPHRSGREGFPHPVPQ